VTAVELVKKNLSVLKENYPQITAMQGNALNLKKLKDESYDITLLFGPMYHLFSKEDKVKALQEAKRVTKKGGYILVAYLMNEYAVITYAFKEGNLLKCLTENKLTKDFKCVTDERDLYSYVRLQEINELNQQVDLARDKIIAVDGATDYIRPVINKMTDEEFKIYIEYQMSICEMQELLGASSHTLDILKKN
jgi:ubiquinone/menaquinone biosynthesis C-methylase UbiE